MIFPPPDASRAEVDAWIKPILRARAEQEDEQRRAGVIARNRQIAARRYKGAPRCAACGCITDRAHQIDGFARRIPRSSKHKGRIFKIGEYMCYRHHWESLLP